MLSDRNYMNRGGGEKFSGSQENPNICIYVLIVINVIVYLTINPELNLYDQMALSSIGIKMHMYWQMITSMFMHGNLSHILFNMWGLYLFGTLVAPHLRTKRFLIMYFIAGLCGNLLWLTFNWESVAYIRQMFSGGVERLIPLNIVGVNAAAHTVQAMSNEVITSIPFADILPVGVVGASGALFGVLIATAMLEPDREFIMLLFPIPIKAKTLVAIYAIIETLLSFDTSGNVAHLAHVGGLLGGYLYIRIFCRHLIRWEPLSFLYSKRPASGPRPTSSKGWTVHSSPLKFTSATTFNFGRHVKDPDLQVTQKELDYLLDKVSKDGINSLDDAEMITLRKAREQMRNQRQGR